MDPLDFVLIFSAATGITNYAKTHLNLSGGYLQIFGGLTAVILTGLAVSPVFWPEMAQPADFVLWLIAGGAAPGTVGTAFQVAGKVGKSE